MRPCLYVWLSKIHAHPHLSCGLAVCSGCLRRHLDYKVSQNQTPDCPYCRAPTDGTQLRPCHALRDAAAALRLLVPAIADLRQTAEKLRAAEAERKASGSHASGGAREGNLAAAASVEGDSKRKARAAADGKQQAPTSRNPPRPSNSPSIEIIYSSSSEGNDDGSDGELDPKEVRVRRGGAQSSETSAKRQRGGDGRSAQLRSAPSSQHPAAAAPSTLPVASSRNPVKKTFGYSSCVVCGMTVRTAFINIHLTGCLEKQEGKGGDVGQGGNHIAGPSSRPMVTANGKSEGRSTAAVKMPPKLVFHILADKEAKKKLEAWGLPTDGVRKVKYERQGGRGTWITVLFLVLLR